MAGPLDLQPHEARAFEAPLHLEARRSESRLGCRQQPVHIRSDQTEEVQVLCLPVDLAPEDHGRPASQCEALGLCKVGDEVGDFSLDRR